MKLRKARELPNILGNSWQGSGQSKALVSTQCPLIIRRCPPCSKTRELTSSSRRVPSKALESGAEGARRQQRHGRAPAPSSWYPSARCRGGSASEPDCRLDEHPIHGHMQHAVRGNVSWSRLQRGSRSAVFINCAEVRHRASFRLRTEHEAREAALHLWAQVRRDPRPPETMPLAACLDPDVGSEACQFWPGIRLPTPQKSASALSWQELSRGARDMRGLVVGALDIGAALPARAHSRS